MELIIKGLIASCVLTSCKGLTGTGDNPAVFHPNILFLLADDQRGDALGITGNTYIHTPNIDSLSQSGIRFSNARIMGGHISAISAPSRAMLMSGKYLFNVYDKLDGVLTLPMYFGQNGYNTFGTGKWHNGKAAFEASFKMGENVFLGGMSDHYNVPCRDMGPDGKLSVPEMRGFSTDIFADAAIRFINQYAEGDREHPFFCYVAFTAPHDPYSPAPEYIDRYPVDALPLPGNFMPLHPFQFDLLTIRDEQLSPWPRSPEIVRAALADYYGLITHMDDKIGNIIMALKINGLFENTIIVYAADNGLAIGSHGLLGKQNLYEHSSEIPLIISGPGIPSGIISGALVYLLDMFPTLAELCNLDAPEGTDGLSLVPLIRGTSKDVRSSIFTAYRNTARAVRTKQWKLIRYPDRDFTQLFNLENDPLEMNNLAGQTVHQEKLNEMLELLKEWQKAANDTVRLTADTILPLEYDHTKLERNPDKWQPEYTINKYFKNY